MYKGFTRIVLIITLLISINCSDKKENEVLFVKEPPAKEDATKAWLHKVENYRNNKNYLTVFYKYYNQKIAQKK